MEEWRGNPLEFVGEMVGCGYLVCVLFSDGEGKVRKTAVLM